MSFLLRVQHCTLRFQSDHVLLDDLFSAVFVNSHSLAEDILNPSAFNALLLLRVIGEPFYDQILPFTMLPKVLHFASVDVLLLD